MMLGFTVNIDFLGIHIHEYIHVPFLLWTILSGLTYRWIQGRIIKNWDGWYDKHPLSHSIFHHHIKGHPAKAAWLCDQDGCKQVSFDDTYTQPLDH